MEKYIDSLLAESDQKLLEILELHFKLDYTQKAIPFSSYES